MVESFNGRRTGCKCVNDGLPGNKLCVKVKVNMKEKTFLARSLMRKLKQHANYKKGIFKKNRKTRLRKPKGFLVRIVIFCIFSF